MKIIKINLPENITDSLTQFTNESFNLRETFLARHYDNLLKILFFSLVAFVIFMSLSMVIKTDDISDKLSLGLFLAFTPGGITILALGFIFSFFVLILLYVFLLSPLVSNYRAIIDFFTTPKNPNISLIIFHYPSGSVLTRNKKLYLDDNKLSTLIDKYEPLLLNEGLNIKSIIEESYLQEEINVIFPEKLSDSMLYFIKDAVDNKISLITFKQIIITLLIARLIFNQSLLTTVGFSNESATAYLSWILALLFSFLFFYLMKKLSRNHVSFNSSNLIKLNIFKQQNNVNSFSINESVYIKKVELSNLVDKYEPLLLKDGFSIKELTNALIKMPSK